MSQSKISSTESAQSTQTTDKSNPLNNSSSMENSIFPEVQPDAEQSASAQPKPVKASPKQHRLDYEEYCAKFLAPIKLEKGDKHQLAISGGTFNRLYDFVRIFGKRGDSVGSYVEHILIEYLDHNQERFDTWMKAWISQRSK